jgi:hypothetical protein
VNSIVVSDLDASLDLKGRWSVRLAPGYESVRFGNFRWRSPEGQTDKVSAYSQTCLRMEIL